MATGLSQASDASMSIPLNDQRTRLKAAFTTLVSNAEFKKLISSSDSLFEDQPVAIATALKIELAKNNESHLYNTESAFYSVPRLETVGQEIATDGHKIIKKEFRLYDNSNVVVFIERFIMTYNVANTEFNLTSEHIEVKTAIEAIVKNSSFENSYSHPLTNVKNLKKLLITPIKYTYAQVTRFSSLPRNTQVALVSSVVAAYLLKDKFFPEFSLLSYYPAFLPFSGTIRGLFASNAIPKVTTEVAKQVAKKGFLG